MTETQGDLPAKKPRACKRPPAGTSKKELRERHATKMSNKRGRREDWYERNGNQPLPSTVLKMRRRGLIDQYTIRVPNFPASVNRRTGKPHLHQREIARRLRQGS